MVIRDRSPLRRATTARSRRRERGASVLIVFLVLTMLTGIGMYAARSATLSTAVAGSSKQLAQTRSISEYAVMNATAALARDPAHYVNAMPKYTPPVGDPKCFCVNAIDNATCFPLSFQQLEAEAGLPLIVPADAAAKIPGGLGAASIEADFIIDITDLAPAAPPVAGEALNPNSPVNIGYLSLTLTSTGQLRPTSTAANIAKNLASSASMQTWRAHVVVGPIANPAPRPFVP
jgi:hypothetical protein